MKTFIFAAMALGSWSVFAQAKTLTTKVSFRGVLEAVTLDQQTGSFTVGEMEFQHPVSSVLKGDTVYTGFTRTNRVGVKYENLVVATLFVEGQPAGSLDFECPGVDIDGVTNARLVMQVIDRSGKATVINDNCLFLEEKK
jgi:hypothetical protein